MTRDRVKLLSVVIVAAIMGCHHNLKGFDQIYGQYANDAQYCLDLNGKYDPKAPSHLTTEEIQKLESLQNVSNPVSLQASATLASYGNQDVSLKKWLIGRCPMLEASKDPNLRDTGVMIALWYRLKEQAPKIDAIEEEISAKTNPAVGDQLTLRTIGTYHKVVAL